MFDFQLIKNIAIIGSGALATFYAFKWGVKYNVSVLGTWNDAINAINHRNLEGDESNNISAFLNWNKVEEPDLVVWLTKTYKNNEALERYKCLQWNSPILILQNGIGQKELFRSILGKDQIVIVGITTQGAKLEKPGCVLNTGDGELIVEQNNVFDGFPVNQVIDINQKVFEKLSINAVINPIAALYNVKNKGVIAGNAFEELKKMISVCFPYFQKRNVFQSEDEYLSKVIQIAEATGENTNSMLADKLTNRPTEVLDILGPVNDELKSEYLNNIIESLQMTLR